MWKEAEESGKELEAAIVQNAYRKQINELNSGEIKYAPRPTTTINRDSKIKSKASSVAPPVTSNYNNSNNKEVKEHKEYKESILKEKELISKTN